MRSARTPALLVALLLVPGSIPGSSGSQDVGSLHPSLVGLGPGHVSAIVQFTDEADAQTLTILERLGVVEQRYTVIDGAHVRLPGHALAQAAALPGVERIDPDAPIGLTLDTSRPAVGAGPHVWEAGFTGANTTVAVVDTGIEERHPSVQGRVVQGVVLTGSDRDPVTAPTSTDADGHGTHVAGIVGGDGTRSTLLDGQDARYSGVAPQTSLVSIDISQSFTTSTAIAAFEWIHNNHEAYGITVVQNSWGREDTSQPFDPGDPAVRASNALVIDDDLVVVFSASNAGPESSTLSMEAMNPNVLTVGAVDDAGRVATFSSRGPVMLQNGTEAPWTKPDVSAPGVGIRSATGGGQMTERLYTDMSGTSQAAPHIAGVAALIRSQAPEIPAPAVHELLRQSARDLGPPGPDPDTGHGFVDAGRALELTAQASNGTLDLPGTETFEASGEIVVGGTGSNILPEDTGVQTNRANGTFPVKPDADLLTFRFSWSPSRSPVPSPDLRIQLTTPDGDTRAVPASGGEAQREFSHPEAGMWSWEATPASGSGAGAADYQMQTQVSVPIQLTTLDGEGGYFDESTPERLQRMFTEATETYGAPLVYGALGLGALLMLATSVGIVRRLRAR